MKITENEPFRWIPGTTATEEAMERMRSRFAKPRKPMGEAWFMGDRKMYNKLMAESLSAVSCGYFEQALFEISGGKTCFPEAVESEGWKQWFQYLLPELILRAHERHIEPLLEYIITPFVLYFEQTPDNEYSGFRRDAVNTLGTAIMHPELWPDKQAGESAPNKRTPLFLEKEFKSVVNKLVGGRRANTTFSAATFFCLKYLDPEDMTSWIDSIMSIESSYWRVTTLNWWIGSQDFLTESSYNSLDKATPEIDWFNTFQLENAPEPFIPVENAKAFKKHFKESLTNDLIEEWEAQLKNEEQFRIELQENQTASLDWLFAAVRDTLKS